MFHITIICICGAMMTWHDESPRTAVFCDGCGAHMNVTITGAIPA